MVTARGLPWVGCVVEILQFLEFVAEQLSAIDNDRIGIRVEPPRADPV